MGKENEVALQRYDDLPGWEAVLGNAQCHLRQGLDLFLDAVDMVHDNLAFRKLQPVGGLMELSVDCVRLHDCPSGKLQASLQAWCRQTAAVGCCPAMSSSSIDNRDSLPGVS